MKEQKERLRRIDKLMDYWMDGLMNIKTRRGLVLVIEEI